MTDAEARVALAELPYRNDGDAWRRLTLADRALLDSLRYSATITDRDRERLRVLVERVGAQ